MHQVVKVRDKTLEEKLLAISNIDMLSQGSYVIRAG